MTRLYINQEQIRSRCDSVGDFLVNTQPKWLLGNPPIYVLGTAVSLASGAAAYNAIKELGFSEFNKYERLERKIDSASTAANNFRHIAEIAHSKGNINTEVVANMAVAKQNLAVSIAKSEQPVGFHPNIAEAATGGGAIAVGLFVGAFVMLYISVYTRAIDSK